MAFELLEQARERVLLAAHRGASAGNIPCNTLAAYDIALRQGADIIEADVDCSSDGVLFIFHPGMEPAHLGYSGRISSLTAEQIRSMRFVNQDLTPTPWGLSTLDELLEHLKGRCVLNLDKFWMHPQAIAEAVRRHGMTDQVIIKAYVKEQQLLDVERYAPDIPFMPIFSECDEVHERLMRRPMRYIGSEVLFTSDDAPVASEAYIERMHRDGKLLWSNAIVYDSRAVLAAGHSDDASLLDDPANGWGWLAERGFDVIQTDWLLAARQHLQQTGQLTRTTRQ